MKNVAKSVRLEEDVFRAIDGYRGEGFNEKLGNLVLDYLDKHDALVRDWELLQAGIADKRQELRQVQEHLQKVREVDRRFSALVDALELLLKE